MVNVFRRSTNFFVGGVWKRDAVRAFGRHRQEGRHRDASAVRCSYRPIPNQPEHCRTEPMSSVPAIVRQYFASAAGYTLTPNGGLLSGGESLIKFAGADGRISARSQYEILGLVAEEVPERAALSVRYAERNELDQMGTRPCRSLLASGFARWHSLQPPGSCRRSRRLPWIFTRG